MWHMMPLQNVNSHHQSNLETNINNIQLNAKGIYIFWNNTRLYWLISVCSVYVWICNNFDTKFYNLVFLYSMVNVTYQSNVKSITLIIFYHNCQAICRCKIMRHHTYSPVLNSLSHTYFSINKHNNTCITTRTSDTHTKIQAKFQYSVFQCITWL